MPCPTSILSIFCRLFEKLVVAVAVSAVLFAIAILVASAVLLFTLILAVVLVAALAVTVIAAFFVADATAALLVELVRRERLLLSFPF